MKFLAAISNNKIKTLKELSELESRLLITDMDAIALFQIKNRKALQTIQIFRDIQKELLLDSIGNIERLIGELLSSFRSFLDYWETSLKREFGKESSQVGNFKRATSTEFDNSFEYRFISGLRNYIQHCGMPNIVKKTKLNNEENTIQQLLFNKSELLKSFEWKSKVRKDLESYENDLDLVEVLHCVVKSVNRINNVAMNQSDINAILNSCRRILEYQKYKKLNSRLAVIEFSQEFPQKIDGVSVMEFPFEVINSFISNIKREK